MKRGLRIALTLAIVVMIASQVDLSVVRNLAERVAPLWLGAALAVLFGVRVLVAWRFKVLLGALGIDRSFGSLLQVTLVSNALGQMLPTGIGQDVIRGHHVVRSHGRGVDVSATIIQERLVGIGSMLVVGLIASLLWLEGPLQVWTASGIVAVGGVFLAAFAVARSWSRRGGELPAFLRLPERARGVLIDVVYAVADTGRLGPVFAFVFIISLGVQLARCVVFWCLYAALGSPVSLVHMFAFVPLVFLLTSLPISLAGVGRATCRPGEMPLCRPAELRMAADWIKGINPQVPQAPANRMINIAGSRSITIRDLVLNGAHTLSGLAQGFTPRLPFGGPRQRGDPRRFSSLMLRHAFPRIRAVNICQLLQEVNGIL